MQRRSFLFAAPLMLPLTKFPSLSMLNSKPFVVKAGEARFGSHTPYKGINPNDVKISGKDTNGQLAVFEYIGNEKVGPPLHVHYD